MHSAGGDSAYIAESREISANVQKLVYFSTLLVNDAPNGSLGSRLREAKALAMSTYGQLQKLNTAIAEGAGMIDPIERGQRRQTYKRLDGRYQTALRALDKAAQQAFMSTVSEPNNSAFSVPAYAATTAPPTSASDVSVAVYSDSDSVRSESAYFSDEDVRPDFSVGVNDKFRTSYRSGRRVPEPDDIRRSPGESSSRQKKDKYQRKHKSANNDLLQKSIMRHNNGDTSLPPTSFPGPSRPTDDSKNSAVNSTGGVSFDKLLPVPNKSGSPQSRHASCRDLVILGGRPSRSRESAARMGHPTLELGESQSSSPHGRADDQSHELLPQQQLARNRPLETVYHQMVHVIEEDEIRLRMKEEAARSVLQLENDVKGIRKLYDAVSKQVVAGGEDLIEVEAQLRSAGSLGISVVDELGTANRLDRWRYIFPYWIPKPSIGRIMLIVVFSLVFFVLLIILWHLL